MTKDLCDTIDLLAYLNGALTEADSKSIETHLKHCGRCQRNLEELQDGFELITVSMTPTEPPSTLRNQVLAAAFQARSPLFSKDGTIAEPVEGEQTPNLDGNHTDVPTNHRRTTRQMRRSSRLVGWLWSSVAVLAVLCVGLGTKVIMNQQEISTLHRQLSTATAMTISLQAAQKSSQASGEAVLIHHQNRLSLIVYVANMRPTKGQEVYHIWLWNHGVRSSAGVMTVNANGVGRFQQALNTSQLDGIGITLEPNANTSVPVGPKVLGASHIRKI